MQPPKTKNRPLHHAILAGLFAALPLVAAAQSAEPGDEMEGGFSTMEAAQYTLEQLPQCLEYKIVGISLRLIIIPPFYYYWFWTPHVAHYSPDMLSMSHVELTHIPYIEFNSLLGRNYKYASEKLFAAVVAKLVGLPLYKIGGGRNQYHKWGEHQSVQFMENTVIGNPVAMFLDMFTYDMSRIMQNQIGMGNNSSTGVGTGIGAGGSSNSGGNSGGGQGGWGGASPQYNGGSGNGSSTRPQVKDKQVMSWMGSWISDQNTEWPTLFSDNMGYQQVMMMMANSPIVQVIKQIMQQIDTALSSVNGKVGDSPFCPVNATPMTPYYLSGFDSYLWRMGYPTADYEHTATIVNPFSDDVIGPTVQNEDYGDALIDLPPEIAALLQPKWGNIYPREGTVNDPNIARVAAVVAKRSQTLLGEEDKPLGRIYKTPKYRINSAAWSKIYPEVGLECRRNIANTVNETVVDDQGKSAWTMWTQHHCDLERKGIHIVTIPIGPIYVTPKIRE